MSILSLIICLIVVTIIYLIVSKKVAEKNTEYPSYSFNTISSLSISIVLVSIYSLIIKYLTNTEITQDYSFRLIINNYSFLLSIIIIFIVLFIATLVYFHFFEKLNKGFKDTFINISEKVGLV